MVVDTSALIAIMENEPERRRFNELIEAAPATYVSAASLLETRMVLFARSGDSAVMALDAFLLKSRMIVMEVSPHIADVAFDAYRRYGKVSGHGATLNRLGQNGKFAFRPAEFVAMGRTRQHLSVRRWHQTRA